VKNADEEDVRLRISRDITARVNRHVGHAPREVRLFPAGTLPKTSSGKPRRESARELLSQGTRRAGTAGATSKKTDTGSAGLDRVR
jgi:fatty-acyl-CoA synthase